MTKYTAELPSIWSGSSLIRDAINDAELQTRWPRTLPVPCPTSCGRSRVARDLTARRRMSSRTGSGPAVVGKFQVRLSHQRPLGRPASDPSMQTLHPWRTWELDRCRSGIAVAPRVIVRLAQVSVCAMVRFAGNRRLRHVELRSPAQRTDTTAGRFGGGKGPYSRVILRGSCYRAGAPVPKLTYLVPP